MKSCSSPRKLSYASIVALPEDSYGIYCIWTKSSCIYVGKAEQQTIGKRLLQHYANCKNPGLRTWIESSYDLYFRYLEIGNKLAISAIEKKLIVKLSPLANVITYRGM